MYQTRTFRPTTLTVTGGLAMAVGAVLYVNDQMPCARNWHVFLWPALILMGVGAIMATAGALWNRED
jgi:hypothetical protein